MSIGFDNPRRPILIDRVFDEPERILELVRSNGPYWPTMRYIANQSELDALDSKAQKIAVAPWFRGDWAYEKSLVPGGDEILANVPFAEAAGQLFDAEVVRPLIVYVNVMGPMGVGPAHIDVPAFRGMDRTEFPVTLLHLMHRSGLFERFRVSIATGVTWFYEGDRGEFEYWADGLTKPPRIIEAPLTNRGVVGDNETMFHRVAPIGGENPPVIRDATLDVELFPNSEDRGWVARDAGQELIHYDERDVRVSISWKAEVFADEEAARQRSEHLDDLGLEFVLEAFVADLAKRGKQVSIPDNPFHDQAFTRALNEAYPLPVPVS